MIFIFDSAKELLLALPALNRFYPTVMEADFLNWHEPVALWAQNLFTKAIGFWNLLGG
jgi:hypothetical protein